MSNLPPEANVGALSFAGTGQPVYCDGCDCRLHSADELIAGEGPTGALLCSECLPEAWEETVAERALEQQQRELLSQAYEAERREEAAAALAADFRRAGNESSAGMFDARRAKWRTVAALKRAAAYGPELIEQEQRSA